jgi:hypothetical protein
MRRNGSKLQVGDRFYLQREAQSSFSDESTVVEVEELYMHEGVRCMKVRVLKTNTTRMMRISRARHYTLTEQVAS